MVQVDPVFSRPSFVHPALRQFGEECRAIIVRLLAYVGGLVALAIIAVDLLSGGTMLDAAPVPPGTVETGAKEALATATWTKDTRPRPAFSVLSPDLSNKTNAYEILRSAQGGRKDILRWGPADGPMVASLVLYRPSGEAKANGADHVASDEAALAEITALVPESVQQIGVIDTKFGSVRLLGAAASDGGRRCLGLLKTFSDPELRLSGLFCQSDSVPVARAQLVCAVNRLTLLGAGSDSRLAELFAKADLQDRDCKNSVASGALADDWVSAMNDPKLRGPL